MVFTYPQIQKAIPDALTGPAKNNKEPFDLIGLIPLHPFALQKYSMRYLQIYEFVVSLET